MAADAAKDAGGSQADVAKAAGSAAATVKPAAVRSVSVGCTLGTGQPARHFFPIGLSAACWTSISASAAWQTTRCFAARATSVGPGDFYGDDDHVPIALTATDERVNVAVSRLVG